MAVKPSDTAPAAQRVYGQDHIRQLIVSFSSLDVRKTMMRVSYLLLQDSACVRYQTVDQRLYGNFRRDTETGRLCCDAVRIFFLTLPVSQDLSQDLWPGPYTFRDISKLDKQDADRILQVLGAKFPNLREIHLADVGMMGVGGISSMGPTAIFGAAPVLSAGGTGTSWTMYPLEPSSTSEAKTRIVARHTVCFDLGSGRRPKLNNNRIDIPNYEICNQFLLQLSPPSMANQNPTFIAKAWLDFIQQKVHTDCSLVSVSFQSVSISLSEAVDFVFDLQGIIPLGAEFELSVLNASSITLPEMTHLADVLGDRLVSLRAGPVYYSSVGKSQAVVIGTHELGEMAQLIHTRLQNLCRLMIPLHHCPETSTVDIEGLLPLPEPQDNSKLVLVDFAFEDPPTHAMQIARHLTAFASPYIRSLTVHALRLDINNRMPHMDFTNYIHHFCGLPRSRQKALISIDTVRLNISHPAELVALKFDHHDQPISPCPGYARDLLARVRAATLHLRTSLDEIEHIATGVLEAVPQAITHGAGTDAERESLVQNMRDYALLVEEELTLAFEGLHPTCVEPAATAMMPWESRWETLRRALGDDKPVFSLMDVEVAAEDTAWM